MAHVVACVTMHSASSGREAGTRRVQRSHSTSRGTSLLHFEGVHIDDVNDGHCNGLPVLHDL